MHGNIWRLSFLFLYFFSSVTGQDFPPCEYPWTLILEEHKILRFENGSVLHEGVLYPHDSHWIAENNKTHGCICNVKQCIRKCCQDDEVLNDDERPECKKVTRNESLPDLRLAMEQLAPELRDIANVAEKFAVIKDRTCPAKTFKLDPDQYAEDRFVLQTNGSLVTGEEVLSQSNYCLDWHESFERVTVLKCFEPEESPLLPAKETIYNVGMIMSIPFLFVTFLVYAVIPELRNIYGKTLMCYVACLVSGYSFLVVNGVWYFTPVPCTVMAFVIHFSFLASFFWLNVMCFDIWWTFGGFRSLQGSIKQRDKKKFIIYSIYAWGCASLLTGVCIIMDFAPHIPSTFIKPQFGTQSCWFTTDEAKAIYFYGPMGVTVFCNICLFVSTALKIIHHKKDTAHHLKGSESRRHDDNKQWFNLYLKLFIVMGINWSMEIISWLCKSSPQYVWYITDLANTLQGLIIFIIFVWKDKIKRLLLKRFGCHDRSILSRNSTRSVYHSSTSRTCTTSAAPLQEKINPCVHVNTYKNKTADESDCA